MLHYAVVRNNCKFSASQYNSGLLFAHITHLLYIGKGGSVLLKVERKFISTHALFWFLRGCKPKTEASHTDTSKFNMVVRQALARRNRIDSMITQTAKVHSLWILNIQFLHSLK
jgi:hypothetical protein